MVFMAHHILYHIYNLINLIHIFSVFFFKEEAGKQDRVIVVTVCLTLCVCAKYLNILKPLCDLTFIKSL